MRFRDATKLPLVIVAAMVAAGAFVYTRLPAYIPTHWGVDGSADVYAAKSPVSVFMLPVIALAVYALLLLMPYVDPRRPELMRSAHAYNIVLDAVAALLGVVYAGQLIASLRPGFDVARLTLAGVGGLFVIVGSYLGRVERNWTFGVRLPWTLESEVVWRKTNRLGGKLFMAAGVVTLLSALLPPMWGFVVLMAVMAAVLVTTYVYAYLTYRRETGRAGDPNGS